MGAWSAEIFDDDGAEEIKEEYKTLLGYGISPQEVYAKIKDYFYEDYNGQHNEDVYWLAIALFQWENGILLDEVKQRALECIEDEEYLERWKESGEEIYQERKQVLADFKHKLVNIVKEERKRFPKCPKCYRFKTKWKVGDLLAYKILAPMLQWKENAEEYKLHESQKFLKDQYVLLRVVDIDRIPVSSVCPELDYASSAVVMLYDWVGNALPTNDEINQLEFKTIVSDFWCQPKRIVSSICLEVEGTKKEQKWCEIILVKSEENYERPQMYLQHKSSPIECVSQFDVTLIQTFALTKGEKTEWYSDKHFFDDAT